MKKKKKSGFLKKKKILSLLITFCFHICCTLLGPEGTLRFCFMMKTVCVLVRGRRRKRTMMEEEEEEEWD